MLKSLRRAALALLTGIGLFAPVPALAVSAPGTYIGNGFDACSAPSSASMDAWLASPYRAVGIYFGGINRACAQPALTADWVTHQQGNGWHLLPIYMGLQAPCTVSNKRYLIDPSQPAAQGAAEADAAVVAADALGLSRGSALIFDMEAYRTDDAACRQAVLTFLGAWTSRLHDRGYLSGVYASIDSGVTDLVADYNSTSRPHPDYLDFARWDGNATIANPAIPAGYFSPHRRIHQYRGGHDETYGGVTINIDTDYVDIAPLPKISAVGDYNGDGRTDLAVWRPSNGIWYLKGIATTQWGRSGDVPVPGDYDGDGRIDLAVWRPSNGTWYLKGIATTQWGTSGDVPVPGDYNGDGRTDLAVWRPRTGTWYIRGIATTQWGRSGDVTVPGDYSGDGRTDLAVWRPTNGTWYVNGIATTQWGTSGDVPVAADYNADGRIDLAVWRPRTGTWYLRGLATSQWGRSGDVPVPGDYNGDGRIDLAVWRPANGTWYVNGIATTQWGTGGDRPVVR